jgi:Carbon storage regulator (could also regulate swarming and quorum sensing)
MLVLTRKEGESLFIGDDIKVTVVSADSEKVRIGIEAPKFCRIYREELLTDTKAENRMAAESAAEADKLAGSSVLQERLKQGRNQKV